MSEPIGGWVMVLNDSELRLNSNRQEGTAQRTLETPHVLFPDVRSTVESQFQQMERAHDRIRVEELTARLGEHSSR